MKPEYYKNRELSWIQFDDRVLGGPGDKTLPLFERLKFLSISASNLDEFFMIRVASLKDMVNAVTRRRIWQVCLPRISWRPSARMCMSW